MAALSAALIGAAVKRAGTLSYLQYAGHILAVSIVTLSLTNRNIDNVLTAVVNSKSIFAIWIMVLIIQLRGKSINARHLCGFIFWVSVPGLVFGLSQYFLPTTLGSALVKEMEWAVTGTLGSFRLTGFLGSPSEYALQAGYCVIYALARVRYSIIALGLVAVVLSLSRITLVGVLGLALVQLIAKGRAWILVVSVAIVVGVAFLIRSYVDESAVGYIVDRLQKTLNPFADMSFAEGRIARWQELLEVVAQHPWGLGLGSTGFRESSGGYIVGPFISESIYIQPFLEIGWVGGFLVCLVYAKIAFSGLKNALNSTDEVSNIISAFTILFLFCGLTSPLIPALPWSMLALTSTYLLVDKKSPTGRERAVARRL